MANQTQSHKKGIILAGGNGSRLHPITHVVTKQLLPIYDKPMIYYSLSVLMLMGVRDILIITKGNDLPLFQNLLGDGSQWGIQISYVIQLEPRGLPDAFILGHEFINGDPVTMILGDNILYGSGLAPFITSSLKNHTGASAFSYQVRDPERFGIAEYDKNGDIVKITEKPQKPKSDRAIIGLYHFDNDVCEKAAALKPSARGETEITDLLNLYLSENRLKVHKMPRGFSWLDTGTSEALIKAGQYVQILEERQGVKIACPEEIAYRAGFINKTQLEKLATSFTKNNYGRYLLQLLSEDD